MVAEPDPVRAKGGDELIGTFEHLKGGLSPDFAHDGVGEFAVDQMRDACPEQEPSNLGRVSRKDLSSEELGD